MSPPRAVPKRIAPVSVIAYTATSAVGSGKPAMQAAIEAARSGLRPNDFSIHPLPTWIGRVEGLAKGRDTRPLPPSLAHWDCRNNRLAWLGLHADGFIEAVAQARERHGASRIGLVLGTSTSSIGATEDAYRALDADGRFPAAMRQPQVHTPHSLCAFVQQALGLGGPALTVSTACSSSAKVFAVAERWLRLGMADAVVVGGTDTLCGSVLFGFNALQLVSPEPCRPFDAERNGISLGEAAGFALLERGPGALMLTGHGEASDAHHMSSPDPTGAGAERALDDALARAGITADAVDYINLHGTASAKNDEIEAALVARRFGARTRASSTKGFTGHTLGAAGIVEAAFSLMALETGWMPGMQGALRLDERCGPQVMHGAERGDVRCAISHSFGFGGTNCVLVFERGDSVRSSATGPPSPMSSPISSPMSLPTVYIESAAFWAPRLPSWAHARAAFRGEANSALPPQPRPAPALLPAAERRRASDTVAIALEVASAAIESSGQPASALASVFSSCHGDLAITDAVCGTLASAPLSISPTRFHNSVHNAASGYWGIATGCREASTAVSAFEASFAAGLFEAWTQVAAEGSPVLLVGVDIEARGALASVTQSSGMLGTALVLSPRPGPRTLAALTASIVEGPSARVALRSEAAQRLAGNAMADALPFFESLARMAGDAFAMPLSSALSLQVQLRQPGQPDSAGILAG